MSPGRCDRCLDLFRTQARAREERREGEARNLVRRWLDHAPAYEPTHSTHDRERQEALQSHYRPRVEPLLHVLEFDDALNALTKLRLDRSQMFDEEWPAPFPEPGSSRGLISFEGRTLGEFERFAENPHAAVPGHLDALECSYLRGSATSMEALQTTYSGSVYQSGDRIHVVWITSREVVYG
ncbi:hypothetical protein BDK92_5405 [Micromonospora pisi]|uniref:Uncharacterized protein n=2 Tax=Micromonospora pisi TaxID=589240 RepID=A0A495JQA6_9ACTN|nr:hypothetical protein BDK92_5405 [Micromonospora pisi]